LPLTLTSFLSLSMKSYLTLVSLNSSITNASGSLVPDLYNPKMQKLRGNASYVLGTYSKRFITSRRSKFNYGLFLLLQFNMSQIFYLHIYLSAEVCSLHLRFKWSIVVNKNFYTKFIRGQS
jgi:hypothetical protein